MGASHAHADQPTWLHGHSHEPNLTPPVGDGSFAVTVAGSQTTITADQLRTLPFTEIAAWCSARTGGGVGGAGGLGGGVRADCLAGLRPGAQGGRSVDIVSVDGFGARLTPADLTVHRPPLLAWQIDHAVMSRKQGLVRLIVPSEVDDALRQVKWIGQILIE